MDAEAGGQGIAGGLVVARVGEWFTSEDIELLDGQPEPAREIVAVPGVACPDVRERLVEPRRWIAGG